MNESIIFKVITEFFVGDEPLEQKVLTNEERKRMQSFIYVFVPFVKSLVMLRTNLNSIDI